MSFEQENPYTVTLHGSVHGVPRTIEFDTRDVVSTRSEIHGEVVSPEQLSEDALQLANDIHRVHEAIHRPLQRTNRMQQLAAKIGGLIKK